MAIYRFLRRRRRRSKKGEGEGGIFFGGGGEKKDVCLSTGHKNVRTLHSFLLFFARENRRARTSSKKKKKKKTPAREREEEGGRGRVRVRGERERELYNRERSLVIHLERELYPSKNPTKQWRQRS